jgi:hypothetical protein
VYPGPGATNIGGFTYGYFDGLVDEVRVFNRSITTTEITNLYNLGATKLQKTQSSDLTSGLVGYWPFNGKDISGTTAYDRSTGGNNGTLTNSPTVTEGRSGQALTFNGTNQYVIGGTGLELLGAWTRSAWVKAPTLSGGTANGIISRGANTVSPSRDYLMYFSNSKFSIQRSDGATYPTVNTSGTYLNNTWYHVVGVFDGTNGTIYVNGVADGAGSLTVSISSAVRSVYIGAVREPAGPLYYANATIDEPRVYNRALSAAEIWDLYQMGNPDHVNAADSQGDSLEKGMVGYWKLDDASGTSAADSSGNGSIGTLTNGPTWTTGQIGGATNFDGTDDYIDLGNNNALNLVDNFSVSVWVNINNITQGNYRRIFGRSQIDDNNRPMYLEYDYTANRYRAIWRNAGTFASAVGKVLTATQWQHFVVTFKDGVLNSYSDGSLTQSVSGQVQPPSSSSSSFIGTDSSSYFPGSLDEVRIYNRALSAEEVAKLYRTTAPDNPDTGLVGYWPFNGPDIAGTTAYDRSGKGNTGTLTNGPTITEGKAGQGISFTGASSQYISAGNVGSVKTISYWIKTNNQANGGIELNSNQYIDDNAVPEGMVNASVYVDGVLKTLYGSEKVPNGDMEANNTWTVFDSPTSQAQSTDTAHGGTYSWKTVTTGGYQGSRYDSLSLVGNTLYKLYAWIYTASGVGGDVTLRNTDNSSLADAVANTIGAWRYTYVYATTQSTPGSSIWFVSNNGATTVYYDDVSLKPVLIRYPITDTTGWHHVVITTNTAVPASAVKIGKGGASYLNGSLDEVRVYNRALTAAEVTALYNAGR